MHAFRWIVIILTAGPLLLIQTIEARPTSINLLYLSSYRIEGAGSINFKRGLQSVFDEESSVSVSVYSEYMDIIRFKDKAHLKQLFDFYQSKYRNIKIDIIVSQASPALDFLLKHRDVLFPGTPVVFALVSNSVIRKRDIPSNFIGITSGPDFAATLETALTALPETRNVLIVGGTSPVDRQYLIAAKNQLKPFENRVGIAYMNQLPLDEILTQVAEQPQQTVIIYALLQQDATGKRFSPSKVAARIARVANAPVFALSETMMKSGLVGGNVMSLRMIGRAGANVALDVVNQEQPVKFTTYSKDTHEYIFDWKQLQRWRIDEEKLPAGSVFLNRKLTFWGAYYLQIISIIILIILETLLIALLLINRSKRTKMEKIVRESEAQLKATAKMAKVGGWYIDLVENQLSWNEETFRIHELDNDRQPDVTEAIQYYHPEDRKFVTKAVGQAVESGKSFDFEARLITGKKNLRWVRAVADIIFQQDKRIGIRGMVQDITDRKTAEEQIKASLREKDILIQEIHHRVKNNMQVINSLLGLQSSRFDDNNVREALRNCQNRVYAMSAVHETLHRSDRLSEIDLRAYLSEITTSLLQAYNTSQSPINLVQEVPEIRISINQAYPIGLIINELMTNSLKYAFKDGLENEIRIGARWLDGQIELTVEDNGVGMPDQSNWRNSRTLGLELVRNLVENQLEGRIVLDTSAGTKFTITIDTDIDKPNDTAS